MKTSKLEQLDSTFQIINQSRFDVRDLPILVPAINQCFEEVDFTYKKLARLIEKDPVLSNVILQLVNSGIFKRPSTVTSLDNALMMLGFAMIRNLIFTFKLKALLNKHDLTMQVSLTKRWLFTLKHAATAMELAKSLKMRQAEEIFLAIIFSDIAAFMLADKYQNNDAEFDEKDFYAKADKLKFVYGAKALKSWNFNEKTLAVLKKTESNLLSDLDIIKLSYYHIKSNKNIEDTAEFKRLPIAIQLAYGKHQLLILKEKEQDIRSLVKSLS